MNMWPKISTREYRNEPRYVVDLRKIGEGVKTFPHTLKGMQAANDLIDKIIGREKKLGESAWTMGLAETAEAAKAFQLLKDSGRKMTLTECVASMASRFAPEESKGLVNTFHEYIKHMDKDPEYKDITVTDAKTKVGSFVRHRPRCYGDPEIMVSNIRTEDIERFLDDNGFTKNTRRGYSYCILMFFK